MIAHISDLHLGEHALDTGSPDKATASGFIKKRRLEMQTHDSYILAVLGTELRAIARSLGSADDRFDFYVITGDLSTNATTQDRFAFARRFILETVPIDRSYSAGLQLPADSVLCIPGNHDVMFEPTPERYLSGFRDLPEPPLYVKSLVSRCGRQFTFFGIDSNLYAEGNLAVGRISEGTMGWFSEQLERWKGPAEAVRVLLLHHHPADLNRFRRRSLVDVFRQRFTVLEDGERLLKLCRGRIDLIMHGHEHFPVVFQHNVSECVIVSAGTTMQWQGTAGSRNSLNVLVFEEGSVRVLQYDWAGARFEEVVGREQRFGLPCAQMKARWEVLREALQEVIRGEGKVSTGSERARELLEAPVKVLELSGRAMKMLEDARLVTVRDIVSKTEAELASGGLDATAINEVEARLREKGVTLGLKREGIRERE